MLKYFNNRRNKGQSTLEYAILIIIILGALLTIQVYIKRGISGRLKSATDDVGEQFSVGNQDSNTTRTTRSRTIDTVVGGVSTSTIDGLDETIESMNSSVHNAEFEYWGADPLATDPGTGG